MKTVYVDLRHVYDNHTILQRLRTAAPTAPLRVAVRRPEAWPRLIINNTEF